MQTTTDQMETQNITGYGPRRPTITLRMGIAGAVWALAVQRAIATVAPRMGSPPLCAYNLLSKISRATSRQKGRI